MASIPNAPTEVVSEALRDKIREELRAELEPAIEARWRQRYDAWKVKDLAEYVTAADEKLQEEAQKYFKQWEEEQKPLDKDGIQALLDQTYATFTVRQSGKEFKIGELPGEIEQKFYETLRKQLVGRTVDIEALTQNTMDQPFEKKVQAFLNTFDGAFDILADTVVLILNPFGDDPEVNRAWVKRNMTSYRQWNVCLAQVEANKLRDFFSQVSRSGLRAQTMTSGLSAQQLRLLAQ